MSKALVLRCRDERNGRLVGSSVSNYGGDITKDLYLILMGTKNFTERYYRDKDGWLKISARGRKFRMTAEQVLNHLLPAIAGVKPNLILKVEHRQ